MKGLLFLSSLLIITSCSSIVRVKYEATIVDDLFHTAQFEYYKSYQKDKFTDEQIVLDARKKLSDIFGENNFQHNNIQISNFGNSELPEDYNFPTGQPLVNYHPFTYKKRYSEKIEE